MILTRYLYPKHNVIYSLYVSLAFADFKQSLFWAYELYFSGFRTEVVDLLMQIWEEYYIANPWFQTRMAKEVDKWRQDMQPEIVATMVKNMICREPDMAKFREKIPELPIPTPQKYTQKSMFIVIKHTPPEYETKLEAYGAGWKLPRLVCQYISYCDPAAPPIQIRDYSDRWLYWAAGSPIWRTRIKKYGGKVDDTIQSVKFSTEDAEEEFMNLFSMEPDEQPLEIQAAWFGEPL